MANKQPCPRPRVPRTARTSLHIEGSKPEVVVPKRVNSDFSGVSGWYLSPRVCILRMICSEGFDRAALHGVTWPAELPLVARLVEHLPGTTVYCGWEFN